LPQPRLPIRAPEQTAKAETVQVSLVAEFTHSLTAIKQHGLSMTGSLACAAIVGSKADQRGCVGTAFVAAQLLCCER
jgi:hypothetical protein